jgi:hypothetical protein
VRGSSRCRSRAVELAAARTLLIRDTRDFRVFEACIKAHKLRGDRRDGRPATQPLDPGRACINPVLKARRKLAFARAAVIAPRRTVAKIRAAAMPPKRPASRKDFADLPSPVSELEQDFRRPVAVLVGDDGNASGPAAGIELEPGRLSLAADAVLQANRERVASMHNRTAAGERQACVFLRTRHQAIYCVCPKQRLPTLVRRRRRHRFRLQAARVPPRDERPLRSRTDKDDLYHIPPYTKWVPNRVSGNWQSGKCSTLEYVSELFAELEN